jgi:hypothetical protein
LGSVRTDRLPDALAVQAEAKVVGTFGAMDGFPVDQGMKRPETAIGCGYGTSVYPAPSADRIRR